MLEKSLRNKKCIPSYLGLLILLTFNLDFYTMFITWIWTVSWLNQGGYTNE